MSVNDLFAGLAPGAVQPAPNIQFKRQIKLFVSNNQGLTIDLSALKIKFSVLRSTAQTPNVAEVRVYNYDVNVPSAFNITSEESYLQLQAGYEGNAKLIFSGRVKQTIIGRESGSDTFVDFIAGDGDLAYNFAIANSSFSSGSKQQDQLDACASAMAKLGVTAGGNTKVNSGFSLYRGKVLHGNARNYMKEIAVTTQSSWSIQDGQINYIPADSYLPGTAVEINSSNGMIGTAQQTLNGVNVKCLLNPRIQVGTRIQLNNAQILRLPINQNAPNTAASIPAPIQTDGQYFVAAVNHTGDTRGTDWYSTITGIWIDPVIGTQNPVEINYQD